MRTLNAAAARRWVDLFVGALAEDRRAIDRINVYPVADGDTGTNLVQTMRAAAREVESSMPDTLGGVVKALAKGALGGARGNSGMLLSQALRGMAEELREVSAADGAALRRALLRADDLASRAVVEPAEGTLLSVLCATAAAAECGSDELGVVVRQATLAAIHALEATPAQLPVLAHAGVVDAGGRGVVLMLDTLHAVVHGGERLAPDPPEAGKLAAGTPLHEPQYRHDPRYGYEIMYMLDNVDSVATAALRRTLAGIGDCVSVISDGAESWAVHVHSDQIGPAIEAGIEIGRVHRIQVTRFADQIEQPRRFEREAAVLACVPTGALADLFGAEGADVLTADWPLAVEDLVGAIAETAAAHVVLLLNGGVATALAEDAATRAVDAGHDVVVVSSASPVQGLSALAVHDPARRRADDVVAMAEAAAATRRGELRIADAEALTWVGRCQPGDVLALVDDEVVLIAAEVGDAACDLVGRMLSAGGELVTVLIAKDAPDSLGDVLAEHLRRTHPEVELSCYPAGALSSPLLIGVE